MKRQRRCRLGFGEGACTATQAAIQEPLSAAASARRLGRYFAGVMRIAWPPPVARIAFNVVARVTLFCSTVVFVG